MVTVEMLGRLLDAGFTKDEIIQLARDEPVKTEGVKDFENPGIIKPENEDNPSGTDNPSDTEHPDDTHEQDNNPGAAFETRLDGIEKRITELIKAVQTSNIKNDSFNNPSETLEDETDKIMRSIIRPEVEKKG